MTAQIGHLFVTLSLGGIFFQVALVAGAPLGSFTQGGRYPGRMSWRGRAQAALAIPVLAFCALAVLSAAGFAGGFGDPLQLVDDYRGISSINVTQRIEPRRAALRR